MALSPDRYFDSEPRHLEMARRLYSLVADAPLV